MGTTRKQRKPLSTTPALDAEPPPPPEPERKIVKVDRKKKAPLADTMRDAEQSFDQQIAQPSEADKVLRGADEPATESPEPAAGSVDDAPEEEPAPPSAPEPETTMQVAAKRRDVSRARRRDHRAAATRDDVPAGVTPPIPAPVIAESQLDTSPPAPIEPTADELADIDSHRFTFQGVVGAYATCRCGAERDLVLRGQRTVRLYRESPAAPWRVAIPRCSRSRA